MPMFRIIGIRHRRKETAGGEAHPTQMSILEDHFEIVINLKTEDEELDFVRGLLPVSWRKIEKADDLTKLDQRHIQWRKIKSGESVPEWLEPHIAGNEIPDKIPDKYDGLKSGDSVAMVLGGSGDRLAYALSRRGDEIGAKVYRIPPFIFQKVRKGEVPISALPSMEIEGKDNDHLLLAHLLPDRPDLFYEISSRDRDTIVLIEAYRYWIEVMKARIACEQRLHQQAVGKIFCSKEGFYPEGKVEDWFDDQKANNKILMNLLAEEKEAHKVLVRAANQLDVYTHLFDEIEGVGPAIGARLISAIQDIRRFETPAKLKAFMGVHVMDDGKFVRRRSGQVANWHPDARQALYLLGDQFNRRSNSVWGQKLRENKMKLREKHPEKLIDEKDKSRYSDGHIHKMAIWRTLTQFVEWLWKEWTEFERSSVPKEAGKVA